MCSCTHRATARKPYTHARVVDTVSLVLIPWPADRERKRDMKARFWFGRCLFNFIFVSLPFLNMVFVYAFDTRAKREREREINFVVVVTSNVDVND